jgi:hypothetical protein
VKRWLLILLPLSPAAIAAVPLQCDVGPVTRVFGSTSWLVYSCSDRTSVVVLSAPGNPASSFYFVLSLEGTNYRVRGEGTGSKAATDAALKELQALSRRDVEALVRETKAMRTP